MIQSALGVFYDFLAKKHQQKKSAARL